MILFGHLGITLALTNASERAVKKLKPQLTKQHIDYRLLLVGSILPDLLDKPLIFIASGGQYSSGRVYGHSLIFLLLISALGLLTKLRSNKNAVFTIALGSVIHFCLDGMWYYPETLFWPFYEILTNYKENSIVYWLTSIFNQNFGNVNNLLQNNIELALLIPEIVGLTILGVFLTMLVLKKQIKFFVKTGKIQ